MPANRSRFRRNQKVCADVASPDGPLLTGNPESPPTPGYVIAPSTLIRATRPGLALSVAHSAPTGPWAMEPAGLVGTGTGVTCAAASPTGAAIKHPARG